MVRFTEDLPFPSEFPYEVYVKQLPYRWVGDDPKFYRLDAGGRTDLTKSYKKVDNRWVEITSNE